jgi:hypothetical protein
MSAAGWQPILEPYMYGDFIDLGNGAHLECVRCYESDWSVFVTVRGRSLYGWPDLPSQPNRRSARAAALRWLDACTRGDISTEVTEA